MIQWLSSITQTTTNADEDVEKKEPLSTVCENANYTIAMESNMKFPQKAKNRITI
jgi:hypothetical protein